MAYALRKTPRSSFMTRMFGMGDVTSSTTSMVMTPIAVVAPMPPTPATPDASSSGLGSYVLWGGLAYLAYWFLSKE